MLQFSDMLQLSSEQRPALVKELYCNVLLGIPEDTIVNAKEFREFRNGFNLHLGSNDPLLIDVSFIFLLHSTLSDHTCDASGYQKFFKTTPLLFIQQAAAESVPTFALHQLYCR